jgi:hypothetical protein
MAPPNDKFIPNAYTQTRKLEPIQYTYQPKPLPVPSLANAIATGRTLAEVVGGLPPHHRVEYESGCEVASDGSGESYGVPAGVIPSDSQHGDKGWDLES